MRYRHCTAGEAAFSLLEVLVATAITVGVGAATFQLFHQNERIFRDQSLKLEMQQSARLIASQVADDVRMTGQGIPALLGDAILPGSGASRLNLRTGFSATESVVSSPAPLLVDAGTPTSVIVESTTGFSSGRQAFLWTENDWARVTIDFGVGGIPKHSLHTDSDEQSAAPVCPAAGALARRSGLDLSRHCNQHGSSNDGDEHGKPGRTCVGACKRAGCKCLRAHLPILRRGRKTGEPGYRCKPDTGGAY